MHVDIKNNVRHINNYNRNLLATFLITALFVYGCKASWITVGEHITLRQPTGSVFDVEIVGEGIEVNLSYFVETPELNKLEKKDFYIESQLSMNKKNIALPWKQHFNLEHGENLHIDISRVRGTGTVELRFVHGAEILKRAIIEENSKGISIIYAPDQSRLSL